MFPRSQTSTFFFLLSLLELSSLPWVHNTFLCRSLPSLCLHIQPLPNSATLISSSLWDTQLFPLLSHVVCPSLQDTPLSFWLFSIIRVIFLVTQVQSVSHPPLTLPFIPSYPSPANSLPRFFFFSFPVINHVPCI